MASCRALPYTDALFGASDSSTEGKYLQAGEEVTVRGEVIENTIDPCLFPDEFTVCEEGGGHFLRLDVGHRLVNVYYAGHHAEPCPNEVATEQASDARTGVTVEVFANVEFAGDEQVTLSVCSSDDYYVRTVERQG